MIWVPTNGLDPGRVKEHVLTMLSAGVKLGVSISLDGIATISVVFKGAINLHEKLCPLSQM